MNLQSQIRHLLTSLSAVGTFVATIIAITPADAKALNDAGEVLVNPLAALLAVLAAALVRSLIGWLGRSLRTGAGEE